jgi:tRNA threonylcarbamoyladenosine biosynthesis protein TsaB
MVDELLRRHALGLKDLDGIAFGRGPGTFTGLRIACGVTQGLAFGSGLPVVGVCTLLALAEAVLSERVVCCLDARMGEIYLAAYARSGEDWHAVHDAMLCAPENAPPLPAGMWVGCGGGFLVHGAALGKRYAGRLSEVRSEVYPHARHIAALGARQFEQGKGVPAEEALPVYLRDKVALRADERPN